MFDPNRIDDVQVSIDPDETHSLTILVVGWDTEGKRKRVRFAPTNITDIGHITKGVTDAMIREGLVPQS